MKAKLLSLIAMAFVAISVSAQGWTEPVKPVKPTQAGEFVPGHTYLVRNVAAGQYLTGSNSWSTQASLTAAGVDDELNEAIAWLVADTTATLGGVQLTGYTFQLNGTYTVNGAGGKRSFTNTFLFRDSEDSGFIDYNNQGKGLVWTVTKAGDYYRIQTAEGDKAYPNAATQYAGWSNVDGEIQADSETGELISGSTVVVFNMTGEDESENIDWEFIPCEEYMALAEVYPLRKEMFDLQESAAEVGLNLTPFNEIYNNPNATVAELSEAVSKIKAEILRVQFEEKWAGASEEEPLDVTEDVLVNPSFDFDNGLEGWTKRPGSGTPVFGTYNGNGENLNGTMAGLGDDSWGKNCEKWHESFDIYQHIDFLPAGVYKFTCQGFFRPDDDDAKVNPPVSAELYAIFPDGSEQVAPLAHIGDYATVDKLYDSGQWGSDVQYGSKWIPNNMSGSMYHFHHYTGNNEELDYTSVLNIIVTEPINGISIGVRNTTKQTWVIFDNFTLTYYGQVDPNKLELADLYKKNLVTYNIDEAKANQDVKRTYEEAMEAAEDPTENFEALLNNLKAATEALVSSMQDYVELEEVYASTRELSDKLENAHGDWDVTDLVSALADDIRGKIDDELADHDYLEAVRDSAINSVRNFIASGDKIKAGDDLTFLLINADFQKTVADKTAVPGWTYVGSELITELSKEWGNIEVFNKSAEIQQTIKNMPVGAYDVTVQGFVRGNQDQVVLYAGDSKTSFKNISEEYMTEPSFGDPENESVQNGDWPYDSHDTENDVYRPNSMQGASIYFATVNPETNEPYYTNHCRIVLKEAGDLTIGVKVSFPVDSWQWCLWDNFRIEYAGAGVELFADEIHNRQDAVRAALADEDAFVTAKAKDMADLAIMAGDEALGGDNLDDVFAAMDQLEEAEAYLKEGKSLAAQLSELAQFYDETMIPNVESGDTDYETFITLVSYPMPQDFADNDELKAALKRVKDGWAGYVLYDVKDIASEENPQDVTPIIYNTDYIDPIQNTPSNNGWTITKDGGNDAVYIDTDVDLDYSAQEFYDNNSFDIHQELTGLEPGYYRVSLQGYYRAGYPSADDSLAVIRNAALYAETQVNTFQSPLLNAMEGAQVVMEGYGNESEIILAEGTDDETYVFIPNDMAAACQYFSMGYYPNECVFEVGEDGLATIGIRRDKHIDGDWTIFTFWALDYLGKTAPTAIEEVAVADNKNVDLKAYDLTGRRVQKLTKGMYIVNGRKVLVK